MIRRVLRLRAGSRMVAVTGVVLAMSLTACGSSSSSDAKKQTPDKAPLSIAEQVANAKAPAVDWPGPTKSVAQPAEAKVTILSCGSARFDCQRAAEAAKNAVEGLGWTATVIDGKLKPSSWNAAASQAATDGQDALIIAGTNPKQMSAGIAQAKTAGIPIIGIFQPPLAGGPDLDGHITVDHKASGALLGKYIIDDSGGSVKLLILDAEEHPELTAGNSALATTIKKDCDGCNVSRQWFNPEQMDRGLAGQITALLRVANPPVDYIFAPYDAMGPFVVEGAIGVKKYKPRTVKFVGIGSSPNTFARIKSGKQTAAIVSSPSYMGWLAVDQVARILAGQSPKQVQYVAGHLVVKDNVDSLDANLGWQDEFDFEAKFLKLWGK